MEFGKLETISSGDITLEDVMLSLLVLARVRRLYYAYAKLVKTKDEDGSE